MSRYVIKLNCFSKDSIFVNKMVSILNFVNFGGECAGFKGFSGSPLNELNSMKQKLFHVNFLMPVLVVRLFLYNSKLYIIHIFQNQKV